jgi:uncharacterized protein
MSFLSFCFDRAAQKYYHARLMSVQPVIDSLEFAWAAQELRGTLAITGFARLQDCLVDADGDVEFVIRGARDDRQRPMLMLEASGMLHLQCQRCLGLLEYGLQIVNSLRLIRPGEQLDEDADDPEAPDYIEANPQLNVAELIEDEILLSLPFAPRHAEGTCQTALDLREPEPAPTAFVKLAVLKEGPISKEH